MKSPLNKKRHTDTDIFIVYSLNLNRKWEITLYFYNTQKCNEYRYTHTHLLLGNIIRKRSIDRVIKCVCTIWQI